ncbi:MULTISPECIES: hypothetical protein [Salinibaculum]|uniref:hypothetical protein n=1 Tax=Salinibaculum TaxID=2732368 RepID=UPI0030D5B5BF
MDAVAVDESTVDAGTSLSGYASFGSSTQSDVHVVLDDGDGTFNSADDSVVSLSASGNLQSWSGLGTSGFSDGTYTIYAWDNTTSSVSDGTNLSKVQEATTTVTIDSTAPTATISSLGQSTVKSGETVSVTYEASDATAGVETATLKFTNASGSVVKTATLSNTSVGSTATTDVTAPSAEGSYTVTLAVSDTAGNSKTSGAESLTVDTTAPNVGIVSPETDANLTSQPTISLSASDNNALQTVEVRIQRTDTDEYYNGSSWVSSDSWVNATKESTTEWSYNTQSNGIVADASYTIVARTTDTAGHTTKSTGSSTTSSAPLPISTAEPKVTYTVDTHKPILEDVTVTNNESGDTVEVGDTVKVSATVSDSTSGVGSVTVDATAFGQSGEEELSHDSGTTYSTTFAVTDFTVTDGSTTVDVTATDAFGQETVKSDSITVDTAVDTVESLIIHAEFVGIVADTNQSVRVTATGLEDDNGNTVTVGKTTLSIAGTTYQADVNDGSIATEIDPTKIANTATTDQRVTVRIVGRDATATTDKVTLVHEAQDLEKGYQLSGTPMPAADVLFTDDVRDVTTYSSTGTSTWVGTDATQVGEGYYINAETADARVGYIFEEDSDTKQDYTQIMDDGFNLVSPAVSLNGGSDSLTITADMGFESAPTGNDILFHVQDTSGNVAKSPSGAEVPPFEETSPSTSVSAYEGYFVEVTDSRSADVFHNIASDGYNESKGS